MFSPGSRGPVPSSVPLLESKALFCSVLHPIGLGLATYTSSQSLDLSGLFELQVTETQVRPALFMDSHTWEGSNLGVCSESKEHQSLRKGIWGTPYQRPPLPSPLFPCLGFILQGTSPYAVVSVPTHTISQIANTRKLLFPQYAVSQEKGSPVFIS